MIKRIHSILLLATLAVLIILPACSVAGTPIPPTTDPNTIYTQAAQTVQVGLTQTAAALPTSTSTPEPSSTPQPSPTLPQPPTPTQINLTMQAGLPTLPSLGTAVPTIAGQRPLATTAVSGQTGDHAAFGSQSPADNSKFPGLQNVQVFWSLVNTGTTTWTTGYKLVWFGGTQLSGQSVIPLEKEVKPGAKGEFYTRMITPDKAGTYTSYWRLTNPSGFGFSEVYLKFIVE